MSHRTKAQKVHAQEQKLAAQEGLTYSLNGTGKLPQAQGQLQLKHLNLFGYDVTLIYKDLLKTVIITLSILTLLLWIARFV